MKIEFTPKELEILESYERGEIDCPGGETREILSNLAERALAYERETESDDDPDNLLLWYYDKYKEQQGIVE